MQESHLYLNCSSVVGLKTQGTIILLDQVDFKMFPQVSDPRRQANSCRW